MLNLAASAVFMIASGTYLDAPIVPGAKALQEPGRYESGRTWDDTLAFYKYHFKREGGVRWRNVVNLPGIKAKHIQSLRKRTKWLGINIYDKQGHIRIFVIPRDKKKSPVKSRR